MKIYLIQHGDSLDKTVDPERPLSTKGKKDIQSLATFLSQLNIKVNRIFHSGKLRAKQTAEILSKSIHSQNGISILPGIEPEDLISPIAYEIESWQEDVLLAGHLPFMSKLVSKLITKDDINPVVDFEPGTMVCLEKIAATRWLIRWMLRPELY